MIRVLLLLLLLTTPAWAQSTVITQSQFATGDNASGIIAVTNTFQSLWAASTSTRGRVGCAVQNTGTQPQYVFFGPIADATIAKSVKLTAGMSVNCQFGGLVRREQVSITGTATETFYASQQ